MNTLVSRLMIVIAALVALTAGRSSGQPVQVGSVAVRAVAQKDVVRPGDQIAIAVVLDHKNGFHTYPSETQDVLPDSLDFAVRTAIEIKDQPAWIAKIDGIQWPEPHPGTILNPDAEGTLEAPLYSGVAVAFVRVVVAENALPGDQRLAMRVTFQACNDRVCENKANVDVGVNLRLVSAAGGETAAANEPELFAAFDQSSWGKGAAATKPKPIEFGAFGWSFKVDPSGPVGISVLLVLALIGGVLLNFTPCVLPVIPIKIISLSSAAGNPRRCFVLGAVMSLGVVAFWLGIGAAMAFIGSFKSVSALFQNPWVPLALGVFMLVMGLGMFNLFTVKLPQAVYSVQTHKESIGGAFLFGVLTAVLSTPCMAPVGGAAAAWAAFQPVATTLSTFTAIGVGMALPYLILSAKPGLVKKMPRTGPASELIKQLMGILIVAVSAYFIGQALAVFLNKAPDPVARGYWWIVGLFVCAGGAWLTWRTIKITRKRPNRIAFSLVGLFLAAAGALIGISQSSHGPVNWTYYTDARFDDAKLRGDVIVLDFTAEYCVNCKALESTVLFRSEVAKVLNAGDGVVPMKGDIQVNPEALEKQRQIQWVSIPLLAVFGPGVGYDEPIKLDWYTKEQVLDAISKARGAGVALAPPSSSEPGRVAR